MNTISFREVNVRDFITLKSTCSRCSVIVLGHSKRQRFLKNVTKGLSDYSLKTINCLPDFVGKGSAYIKFVIIQSSPRDVQLTGTPLLSFLGLKFCGLSWLVGYL